MWHTLLWSFEVWHCQYGYDLFGITMLTHSNTILFWRRIRYFECYLIHFDEIRFGLSFILNLIIQSEAYSSVYTACFRTHFVLSLVFSRFGKPQNRRFWNSIEILMTIYCFGEIPPPSETQNKCARCALILVPREIELFLKPIKMNENR